MKSDGGSALLKLGMRNAQQEQVHCRSHLPLDKTMDEDGTLLPPVASTAQANGRELFGLALRWGLATGIGHGLIDRERREQSGEGEQEVARTGEETGGGCLGRGAAGTAHGCTSKRRRQCVRVPQLRWPVAPRYARRALIRFAETKPRSTSPRVPLRSSPGPPWAAAVTTRSRPDKGGSTQAVPARVRATHAPRPYGAGRVGPPRLASADVPPTRAAQCMRPAPWPGAGIGWLRLKGLHRIRGSWWRWWPMKLD